MLGNGIATGPSDAAAHRVTSGTVLAQIAGKLEQLANGTSVMAEQAEQLGERIFGSTPVDPKPAPIPQPPGEVGLVENGLAYLEHQLARVAAAIDRISQV